MPRSTEVTSKRRAELRSQAQSLDPVVMVGREGLTDGVVAALDKALEDHELVKVRFQDYKDQVKDISNTLAQNTQSLLVSTTGFTAVFYRKSYKKN